MGPSTPRSWKSMFTLAHCLIDFQVSLVRDIPMLCLEDDQSDTSTYRRCTEDVQKCTEDVQSVQHEGRGRQMTGKYLWLYHNIVNDTISYLLD